MLRDHRTHRISVRLQNLAHHSLLLIVADAIRSHRYIYRSVQAAVAAMVPMGTDQAKIEVC